MTAQVERNEKNVERRKLWLKLQKEKQAAADKLTHSGFMSTMG